MRGAGRVRSVGRVETADLSWVKTLKIAMRGAESRPKSPKIAENAEIHLYGRGRSQVGRLGNKKGQL